MQRTVVTGGAGFIGSNLVDRLVERGDEVLAVDDLSTGREENLATALGAGARLERVDVRDADALARRLGEPDAVFHLAAQVDVRRAVADPAFDAAVNVGGTVTVLEAARRVGARVFVNASTGGAIYGEGEGRGPLAEDAACRPEGPYGQSKLAAEGYVELFRRMYSLPAVSLRLGNVYGPRQDPLGEAGVVAIFSGALSRGEPPTVYGTGTQTRDYVYVDDVVEAFLAAERRLLEDPEADLGPLNVATGRETGVLELVELLGRIADGEVEPRSAPARRGEVNRVVLDCGRARTELGWEPLTALEEGLERTYAALAGG